MRSLDPFPLCAAASSVRLFADLACALQRAIDDKTWLIV
jgi:hypothetical protein